MTLGDWYRLVVFGFVIIMLLIVRSETMADETELPFRYRLVTAIDWSDGGDRLAASTIQQAESFEGIKSLISVRSSTTGQSLWSMWLDGQDIVNLHWRSEDQELLAISAQSEVTRFDAQTGAVLSAWSASTNLTFAAPHPLQRIVALFLSQLPIRIDPVLVRRLELRDEVDGTTLTSLDLSAALNDSASWLGWSPDGNFLALLSYAGEAQIFEWNGQNLQFVRSFSVLPQVLGSSGNISGAWSPDSTQLAVAVRQYSRGSGLETVYEAVQTSIYDIASGTQVRTLEVSGEMFAINWNAANGLIAAIRHVGSAQTGLTSEIRVWSSETGSLVSAENSGDYFTAAVWSPNDQLTLGRSQSYAEWAADPDDTNISFANVKAVSNRTFEPPGPSINRNA